MPRRHRSRTGAAALVLHASSSQPRPAPLRPPTPPSRRASAACVAALALDAVYAKPPYVHDARSHRHRHRLPPSLPSSAGAGPTASTPQPGEHALQLAGSPPDKHAQPIAACSMREQQPAISFGQKRCSAHRAGQASIPRPATLRHLKRTPALSASQLARACACAHDSAVC